MVTCKDDSFFQKSCARDHGAVKSDLQRHLGNKPYLLADHDVAGLNQRMTDIQASLGTSQMRRANQIVFERQAIAKIYDQELLGLSWLRTPHTPKKCQHGYQSYPCYFMPRNRGTKISSIKNEIIS